MKKILLFFSFLVMSISLFAQPFGNEWINYSKTYYKVKVGKDGLYRISYSALQNAGLNSLSPAGFKLFNKGQEVPIFVTSSTTLGSSDYIEFVGNSNTGELDEQLYADPEWQLNPYHSLFTDTAAYYLVWDNATPGKRYADTPNNISGAPAPETFFTYTAVRSYPETEVRGTPFRLAGVYHSYPDFEDGEGFACNAFGYTDVGASPTPERTFTLNTPGVYTGAGAGTATFRSKLVGRTNDFTDPNDHHIQIEINGTTYADLTYEAYARINVETQVLLPTLNSASTAFKFKVLNTDLDLNSVPYVSLTYPRSFNFDGSRYFEFTLANSQQKYLEISNFNGGTSAPILYDITNRLRLTTILEGGVYKVLLPAGNNPATPRKLVMVNVSVPCNVGCSSPACIPANCSTWVINSLQARQFTNFGNGANQGNYIIITNRLLRSGTTDRIQEYANYRSSAQGGSYDVIIADMNDLYDQFSYGVMQHPMSIRNFLNYALGVWGTAPQYVVLMGKSIKYTSTRLSESTFNANLVPTWGFPSSDNMLTVADVDSYYPRLPVGRISANTPAQVKAYLDKVIEYEADIACNDPNRDWIKRFVHVTSAKNDLEHEEFTGIVEQLRVIAEDQPSLGANVIANYDQCSPYCDAYATGTSFPAFANNFNNGLAFVTLIGHSEGYTGWNFDISSDPNAYNNEGKYPIMLTGSCFVGDVHQYYPSSSNPSMAEKYILADNRGAIGYMATVQFGIPTYLEQFGIALYQRFSNTFYGQPMGKSMLSALQSMHTSDTNSDDYEGTKVTVQEYTYVGDPAVTLITSRDNPDYVIQNSGGINDVTIFNGSNGPQISAPYNAGDIDTLVFHINVHNLGRALTNNLAIRITQQLPGGGTLTYNLTPVAPAPLNDGTYIIYVPVNNATMIGTNGFTISVDPANTITELCENNNSVSLQVTIQSGCADTPLPTINTSIPTSLCSSSAAITLSASPAGGTFAVDNTNITGNSFNPALYSSGSHNISYTYTALNGCVASTSVNTTILQTPSTAINAGTASVCAGTALIIQPQTAITGATYTWNWGGGVATNIAGNQYSVVWSTPGTKTITLNAANGSCTSSPTNLSIEVAQPLAQPAVSCQSTANSITFSWEAISGATNYVLNINNGGNIENITTNSYTLTGLTPGQTASIIVLAQATNNPCGNSTPSVQQVCAAQDCEPLTPIINGLNTSYCTADAVVTLSGLPNGGSFTVNGNAATTLSPASGAGTYVVQYNYSLGSCEYASAPITVTVYDLPVTPVISGALAFCPTSSTTLSVEGSYAGYEWNIAGQTTPTLTVTEPGIYSVTVSNQGGCEASALVEVSQLPTQTLNITSSAGNVICNQATTLIATSGFANYQWTGVFSTNNEATVSLPGTYSVVATDLNGCSWNESITLTGGTISQPTILGNTQICNGQNTSLDAGNGYFSYVWSTGDNSQTINVGAGSFTVTVTNEDGCSAVASVLVQETTLSVSAEASPATICTGENATLTATAIDGATYLWSNGETTSIINVGTPDTYTVTVSLNGCTSMAETVVSISADSTPQALFEVLNPALCMGQTLALNNNSTNAASFQWTLTNTTTGSIQTSSDPMPNFSLNEAGSYNLSLFVTANCGTETSSTTLVAVINASNGPQLEITSSIDEICPGDEIELSATTTASLIQWTADGTSIGNTPTVTDNPLTNTIYTAIAIDASGCAQSDTIEVKVAESCEIPNVITPNNDGYNDTWRVPGAKAVTVEIYNRWGQLVYNKVNYDDTWNGTNNDGNELAHGTYYYIVRYEGESTPVSGNVTIIR